jgi:hypothetical protein
MCILQECCYVICVLAKEDNGDTILPEYKIWAFNTLAAVKMGDVVHWQL